MRPRLVLLAALLIGLVSFALTARADRQPAFVVIVHPSCPQTALRREFVGDAFLKKTTRWQNGEVIRPVDLPPSSATRAQFSEQILRRSVSAVKSYWQQIIFAGRDVPPPELAGEEDVVKFVAKTPNSIGYISATTAHAGTRPVTIE